MFHPVIKDHLANTRVRFADRDNNSTLDIEPLEVTDEDGETVLEYQEYVAAKSYYLFGE